MSIAIAIPYHIEVTFLYTHGFGHVPKPSALRHVSILSSHIAVFSFDPHFSLSARFHHFKIMHQSRSTSTSTSRITLIVSMSSKRQALEWSLVTTSARPTVLLPLYKSDPCQPLTLIVFLSKFKIHLLRKTQKRKRQQVQSAQQYIPPPFILCSAQSLHGGLKNLHRVSSHYFSF